MPRRIITGALLTIASFMAISVTLDSVSAPAGGSPPIGVAALASTSVSGTLSSPANLCTAPQGVPQGFDASYTGSPSVGSVALHIAGCLGNNSTSSSGLGFNNGSFTMTTNVGTLRGSAAGPETFPSVTHTELSVQLTLSVQTGTGSFAGTTGYLQFETLLIFPFSGGFSGIVSVAVPTTTVFLPSSGVAVSGSTILDASATNATSVEFLLFGGIYGFNAPVLCTATLTEYGWLCSWNSATAPNGTYILIAEASNSTSTAFSPNVNITVKNPPGQHRKITA